MYVNFLLIDPVTIKKKIKIKLKIVNIKINFGLIVEMFYDVINNHVYSNILVILTMYV